MLSSVLDCRWRYELHKTFLRLFYGRLDAHCQVCITTAVIEVITSITINAPQRRVAAYASNPDNATEWYENIVSVVWQTPKPLEVGSRIVFTARFLGRTLSYTYEVLDISSSRFVMRTAHGPFPMETRYLWDHVTNNVTKMILVNKGEPAGFSKLVAPFIAMLMRRANEKDLRKLKSILERNSHA